MAEQTLGVIDLRHPFWHRAIGFATDELLHFWIFVFAHLLRGALSDDLSLVCPRAEHDHPRADPKRAGHVVRDDDRGDTEPAGEVLGEAIDHIVSAGQHQINVRGTPETSIEPGTPVYVRFDPSKLSLVPMS